MNNTNSWVPLKFATHSPLRGECPPPGLQSDLIPGLAYLELTSACNSRCPGCLNESFIANFQTRALKHEFRQQPMSYETWHRILSLLPASITSIILSGGEPTLHPEFEAIVEELATRSLDFVLFTNGRWQAPSQIISLLSNLPQFQGFLISLHGASMTSHETFTGVKGSFRETVKNIETAAQTGLPVSISTVITQQNLSEINAIVDLASKLGVEEVNFNRYLLTPGRLTISGERIQTPSATELRQAIAQIEVLRKQFSDQIHIGYGPCIPQCFASSSSLGCSAGKASFVIDPWGNLKPCLHTNLLVGNLLKEGFDILWESPALKSWRGLFDAKCTGCSAFSQCGGGCRAMTLASGLVRDPLMVAPLTTAYGNHPYLGEVTDFLQETQPDESSSPSGIVQL